MTSHCVIKIHVGHFQSPKLAWSPCDVTVSSHVILSPLVLVTDHRKNPILARFSLLFLTKIRILVVFNLKTQRPKKTPILRFILHICTIKVKCMGLPLKTYQVEQSVEWKKISWKICVYNQNSFQFFGFYFKSFGTCSLCN